MSTSTVVDTSLRLLVIDDEPNIRLLLTMCLTADGHHARAVGTVDEALDAVAREAFDLIFLDLRLGTDNGLDILPQLVEAHPWTRVIVITAYASIETAVEAMKRGASDYLAKPFEAAQVQLVTMKVAERRQLERRIEALRATVTQLDANVELTTDDPKLLATLEMAQHVGRSRASLLIAGEPGTGKVRLARQIHEWSDRAVDPFVIVSCRAANARQFEKELFGDGDAEPGLQTGADAITGAKLEFGDGGTLVLDEVGDLPPSLQTAVLHLVEHGEFERPGTHVRRRANLRVIATTSTSLQRAVARGTFRADLLLALGVVQLDIPPLRERAGDIDSLGKKFLEHFARENGRQAARFSPTALHVLRQHRWPGNLREFRNVIERAVLLCDSKTVDVPHLPPNLVNGPSHVAIGDLVPLDQVEELHIRRVVAATRSLRQAAAVLGIDSGTLVRRMKRYDATDAATPPHSPNDQPAA